MRKTIAAALRFDDSLPAPFVLARERGVLAERLVALARTYGVPVQENEDLAQRLVVLQPGEVIPEDVYQVVAEILTAILRIDGNWTAEQ